MYIEKNGNDCGVYTLIVADCLNNGIKVNKDSFNDTDIRLFRKRILSDIINGRISRPFLTSESTNNNT